MAPYIQFGPGRNDLKTRQRKLQECISSTSISKVAEVTTIRSFPFGLLNGLMQGQGIDRVEHSVHKFRLKLMLSTSLRLSQQEVY